ncbi:MAG TPA: hydantoinase B/oxoprolinase family protein, partial [Solirubrobacterales bacterium]|nr:hydantoinase B/oxoprolinase family protein [Solirubrobacterales bacterium]
ELDPGTITAAEYPAATSCGPPVAIVRTTCMATVCLGKMVVSDPGLAREANAPGGPGAFPNVVLSGSSRTGEPYMNWMIDPLSGSIGAYSWRDGVSTGGQLWNPLGTIPNVEHEEQMHPYIYLFRKELPDSGGAGEFRGGNGGVAALKMHKTAASQLSTTINGRAAPATAGMFGGYAGSTNALSLFRESGIDAVFAAGQVPAWPIELGAREIPPNKGNDIDLDEDCLLEYSWAGGGGYGDPLKRDPDRVAADLAEGSISRGAASEYFGVVLAADGTVDESSTARLRAELIAARRAEAAGPAAERVHDADALERGRRVHATIRAVSVAGEWRFAGPSGADLGPLERNYKDRCLKRERDVTVVSPLIGDPHLVVDDSFVLREYFDPVDISLLETEIARPEDPILWDLRPRLEPGSSN